jgi:hypothetical protein
MIEIGRSKARLVRRSFSEGGRAVATLLFEYAALIRDTMKALK